MSVWRSQQIIVQLPFSGPEWRQSVCCSADLCESRWQRLCAEMKTPPPALPRSCRLAVLCAAAAAAAGREHNVFFWGTAGWACTLQALTSCQKLRWTSTALLTGPRSQHPAPALPGRPTVHFSKFTITPPAAEPTVFLYCESSGVNKNYTVFFFNILNAPFSNHTLATLATLSLKRQVCFVCLLSQAQKF